MRIAVRSQSISHHFSRLFLASTSASMPQMPPFLEALFKDGCEEKLDRFIASLDGELIEHDKKIVGWSKEELKYLQSVRRKNRYPHRPPYERSRVYLSYNGPCTGNGEDYINASYLRFPRVNATYIATQAPLESTIEDFWRMVWEQDVHLIVILVALQPRRCELYWPTTSSLELMHGGQSTTELSYAGFTVEAVGGPVCLIEGASDLVKRTFRLSTTATGESRLVTQMHFQTWPDHDVPASLHVMRALMEALTVERGYKHPIVVHCSAGIGRTGTFCVIDAVIRRIKSDPDGFVAGGGDPVVEIIKEFRNQRTIIETFV